MTSEKGEGSIVIKQILNKRRMSSDVMEVNPSTSPQRSNSLAKLMNFENKEKAFAKPVRGRPVVKKFVIPKSKITHDEKFTGITADNEMT